MVVTEYQVVIAGRDSTPARAELQDLLEQILEHTGVSYVVDVVGSETQLEYKEVPSDAPECAEEAQPETENPDVDLIRDGIRARVAQVGAPMSFYAFAEMCKRAGISARRAAKCAGLSLNQWNYAHRTARFSDDVADKLRQTYGVELIRKGGQA